MPPSPLTAFHSTSSLYANIFQISNLIISTWYRSWVTCGDIRLISEFNRLHTLNALKSTQYLKCNLKTMIILQGLVHGVFSILAIILWIQDSTPLPLVSLKYFRCTVATFVSTRSSPTILNNSVMLPLSQAVFSKITWSSKIKGKEVIWKKNNSTQYSDQLNQFNCETKLNEQLNCMRI